MDEAKELCCSELHVEGERLLYRFGFGLAFVGVLVFSMFGNTMLWCVVRRSRRPQSAMNHFVLSLAAGDMALGVALVPVLLGELWRTESSLAAVTRMCSTTLLAVLLLAAMQGVVIALVAIDSFHSVSQPVRTVITSTDARRLVLAVWGSSLLVAISMVAASQPSEARLQGNNYVFSSWCLMGLPSNSYVAYTCCTFLAPLLLAAGIYVRLCVQYWKKRRANVALSHAGRIRWHKVLMWIGVSTAHALVWAPFYVSLCTPLEARPVSPHLMPTLLLVAYGMSLARPLLYYFLNSGFKQGCKEILYAPQTPCRSDAYAVTYPTMPALRNAVGILRTSKEPIQLSTRRLPNPATLLAGGEGGIQTNCTASTSQQEFSRPKVMYEELLHLDSDASEAITHQGNYTSDSILWVPSEHPTYFTREEEIFMGNTSLGMTHDYQSFCKSEKSSFHGPCKGSRMLEVPHFSGGRSHPFRSDCSKAPATPILTIVRSKSPEEEHESPSHANTLSPSSCDRRCSAKPHPTRRREVCSNTSALSGLTFDSHEEQQRSRGSHDHGLCDVSGSQHRHSWPRLGKESTAIDVPLESAPLQRGFTPLGVKAFSSEII